MLWFSWLALFFWWFAAHDWFARSATVGGASMNPEL
ncbi:hypothetical protein JOE66_000077 [Subtercola frigoramans]|uniref:Uncharacterized protein n=1 Tax=Subtercola frigoramans TaxID=120298 RepID=A0ABS2L036_9MICO|nr:hypothetical protein [Subtercola frigoramans]